MKTTPRILQARFVRKPYDLGGALEQLDMTKHPEPINIEAKQSLVAAEYDAFVANFSLEHDWLAGYGGFENGYRCVVEVEASQRRTLYIDPSGSNCARYVGFAEEA